MTFIYIVEYIFTVLIYESCMLPFILVKFLKHMLKRCIKSKHCSPVSRARIVYISRPD